MSGPAGSGPAHLDALTGIRGIAAWSGVRGIGSVYYLMFAISHGLPR